MCLHCVISLARSALDFLHLDPNLGSIDTLLVSLRLVLSSILSFVLEIVIFDMGLVSFEVYCCLIFMGKAK